MDSSFDPRAAGALPCQLICTHGLLEADAMPLPYANPKAAEAKAAAPKQVPFDPEIARQVGFYLAHGLEAAMIHFQMRNVAEPNLINAYIREAQKNAFFRGAAELQLPLKKKTWILRAQRLAWQQHPDGKTIPRRKALSPDTFLRDHYANQRPVVIEGLVDDWPALSAWSVDYIEEKVGRETLIEAQVGRERSSHTEKDVFELKKTIPFGQLADHMRQDGPSNNMYVTANNGAANRQAFDPLWADFAPIEGYTKAQEGHDGFLWIGPKGTITPFHHDVTNNLLIQVKGRKKVYMAPNWEEAWMRSDNRFFSGLDLETALNAKDGPALMECTIGPGDALYMPVGWWHHITSLEESYSVLFTNFVWPNEFREGFPYEES